MDERKAVLQNGMTLAYTYIILHVVETLMLTLEIISRALC